MPSDKEVSVPREERECAAAVFVVTPEGIFLVRDPETPGRRAYWKLPGGKSNPGETPQQVAVRGVEEETGVRLAAGDLRQMYAEAKQGHALYFFRVELSYIPELKAAGDEGEKIRIFSPLEILAMSDFFFGHRRVVEKHLRSLARQRPGSLAATRSR